MCLCRWTLKAGDFFQHIAQVPSLALNCKMITSGPVQLKPLQESHSLKSRLVSILKENGMADFVPSDQLVQQTAWYVGLTMRAATASQVHALTCCF